MSAPQNSKPGTLVQSSCFSLFYSVISHMYFSESSTQFTWKRNLMEVKTVNFVWIPPGKFHSTIKVSESLSQAWVWIPRCPLHMSSSLIWMSLLQKDSFTLFISLNQILPQESGKEYHVWAWVKEVIQYRK